MLSGTWRNIIVVTGLPACGKTKIAASIAWWLSCSLLSLEEILQGLRTPADDSLPAPTSEEAKDLVSTGIRILFSQVGSHIARSTTKGEKLRRCLSDHCIVLDFPFAFVSELECLSAEWSMNHEKTIHIILIKCRPLNERHWRMVFDQGQPTTTTTTNWFKPKSWDEIQMAIRQDDKEDLLAGYADGKEMVEIFRISNDLDAKAKTSSALAAYVVKETSTHVSTLLIDPFTCVKPTRKYSGSAPNSYLFYTVYHLLIQRDLHEKGPCCVNLQTTGWEHCDPDDDHYHEYVWGKQRPKGLLHKTECYKCREQVVGSSYYCQYTSCPLGFHLDCIEAMYSEDVYFSSDDDEPSDTSNAASDSERNKLKGESISATPTDGGVHQSVSIISQSEDSQFKSYAEHLSIGQSADTHDESNSNTESVGDLLLADKTRLIRLFQGLHTCESCHEYCRSQHGRNICLRCRSCLFQYYVKDDYWPSELLHPLHRHVLELVKIRTVNFIIPNSCAACGEHILYDRRAYCCSFCNTYIMHSCMFLPMEIANDHVGYKQHPMQLRFSPHDEELCNYICHICWEERDPNLWYYYCEDCDYSAHINCVFKLNLRTSTQLMVEEPHSGSSVLDDYDSEQGLY